MNTAIATARPTLAAATTTAATTTPFRPASAAPRLDLYAPIHKAWRSFMMDTLWRIGQMDVSDADDMARTLAQLESLLRQCESHIEHENTHVHTAIERRQPDAMLSTPADHAEHHETIAALRFEIAVLRGSDDENRTGLALRLYRHLALFVAENFQHMHHEETVNNGLLWANYSDEELVQLHEQIVASISPEDNLLVARWMIPALNPAERAAIVGGMKPQMPPEAFLGVMSVVQPHMDATGWDKLARAVGIAQQPGLVDVR